MTAYRRPPASSPSAATVGFRRLPGRQHQPDAARRGELRHEVGEAGSGCEALVGKRAHRRLAAVVHHAGVPGARQPPREVSAHSPQSDHADLHPTAPEDCWRPSIGRLPPRVDSRQSRAFGGGRRARTALRVTAGHQGSRRGPDLTLRAKEPKSRAAPRLSRGAITHPWGFPKIRNLARSANPCRPQAHGLRQRMGAFRRACQQIPVANSGHDERARRNGKDRR